jgi:hypothetical protein
MRRKFLRVFYIYKGYGVNRILSVRSIPFAVVAVDTSGCKRIISLSKSSGKHCVESEIGTPGVG